MNDDSRFKQISETAEYLLNMLPRTPEVAIVLGSGLGPLANRIQNPIRIPYHEIPGFVATTAPGHEGRLVFGQLGDKDVLAMQGRFHYYEGHDIGTCIFPIQVFARMCIPRLLVSNAAGGINRRFTPGDLMLITDIITMFCPPPMRGANIEEMGTRFFDMTFTFDQIWQDIARFVAREQNFALQEGVYVYMPGPHFETPADIIGLRHLGADAVGMSTVPEIIAARHADMKILGISCITNLAAGMLNQKLSGEEVNETAHQVEERFCAFVSRIIEKI